MKELTRLEAEKILSDGGCITVASVQNEKTDIYKMVGQVLNYWNCLDKSWRKSLIYGGYLPLSGSYYQVSSPPRKTENLTLKEARVALAEGFEVGFGNCCWIWNNLGLGFKLKGTWTYHYGEIIGPDNEQGSYFIIPHEPEITAPTSVPLNYDQAVEAIQKGKTVNIQMPTRKNPTVLKPTSPDNQHQISVDGLLKLDLASRKGYEIWMEE